MQVSDQAVTDAIAEATRLRGEQDGQSWTIGVSRWDLAAVLAGCPEDVGGTPRDYPQVPEAELLARLDDLVQQGVIDGCACGCRGDFIVLQRTPV